MSLQGDLAEIPIGEVIQTLSLNNHEGTLRIRAPSGEKLFYLSKGEAQLIVPGKKATRLGEALVRTQRLTKEQLEKALEHHAKSGKILGKALIDLGLITEGDIEALVRRQFRDEFFEIFLLDKGTFEFLFDVKPDRLVSFDEELSRVSLNTSSLMMEALRQIDEWKQMTAEIATPRAIFEIEDRAAAGAAIAKLDVPDDARRAIDLVDGRRPLADIVRETGAAKFDIYSVVYELLKRGAARALTHPECRRAAIEAEEGGDTYAATVFYDFGLFLEPDDVDLRERQFKLLKRLGIYDEAKASALAIGDWHVERDESEAALAFYLEAHAIDEKDVRAAEGIFRCYTRLQRPARALKAGDELVRLALRRGDLGRAAETLTTLLTLEPGEQRRRVQLGEVLADQGRKKEALDCYDAALAALKESKNDALTAEVCRKILELDDKREEVRALLKTAAEREEKTEGRRTRRLRALNIAALPLIILAWCGIYEWSARSEIESAINEAARSDANLKASVERLRYVAREYRFSTKAAEARERADELEARAERAAADARKLIVREQEKARETEQDKRRQQARALLASARTFERKQNYAEAVAIYLDLVREYGDVQLDQRVRLPIPIASEPSGARVKRGADDLGLTPLIYQAEPLREVQLRIEHPGFAPFEVTIRGNRFEEVRAALERAPLWTYRAEGAVEVAPAVGSGRLFVVARDGVVHALDAKTGEPAWREKIGEWGDAFSPPAVIAGKLFVGTSEGRLFALDLGSGRPLFSIDAGGAVRGEPRASPDGPIVAFGGAGGSAQFVRAANGERLFAVKTEHRIDAAVAFGRGAAYVGSRDGNLYAVALPRGEPRWTFAAGEDVLAAPAVAGDLVVFGARDGRVYGVEAASGKEKWRLETGGRIRAPVVAREGTAYVASEDGRLYAIDAASGRVTARFDAGAPITAAPALGPRTIYVPATDGGVTALDRSSFSTLWRYSLGAPCYASPVVADGRVIVAGADGTVRALLE